MKRTVEIRMEPASVFIQLFPCFVTSLKSYFLITTAYFICYLDLYATQLDSWYCRFVIFPECSLEARKQAETSN